MIGRLTRSIKDLCWVLSRLLCRGSGKLWRLIVKKSYSRFCSFVQGLTDYRSVVLVNCKVSRAKSHRLRFKVLNMLRRLGVR